MGWRKPERMMKRVFQDITNVSRKNIKLTIHRSSHRRKLVKWLYEVMDDFGYSQVTFSTAVFILDRYTEVRGLDLGKYQLVGISSLFLSAKIEEKRCKEIDDYVHVTDNTYSRREILDKEIEILEVFGFNLMFRLPHSFLKEKYLEKMSSEYTVKQCQEIFFCAFSYVIEKNICGSSMYWIYLEGIKEAEKVLSGHKASEDFRFYLENNRRIKNIFM
ncbi:G2/mitotic specific cyclin 1 [Encephalitozoon intestinalis ATCC 50506]|uniref:G2/mitotic specific cyclin 1 n=1 Tax=Encephalitozoon intestinalis (strain ATCC 50506) TaxID=876142 RepID=E0S8W4_ENCIT|nr:G2/mitotic specific cyclin 1 [Encephalitozoon intestinalis ATCC 50506]ADM12230.1 G2/mitotic specific cyclin 1 [Encephalitozoon intestinalis ATCC 50506]UTX46039.1 G2/mitotic-specific cyclin-3 [Encephalitozoon intestinalis]